MATFDPQRSLSDVGVKPPYDATVCQVCKRRFWRVSGALGIMPEICFGCYLHEHITPNVLDKFVCDLSPQLITFQLPGGLVSARPKWVGRIEGKPDNWLVGLRDGTIYPVNKEQAELLQS